MVAMELAEVVNPPFIFPVVGVVLCAVLVYAFGFKSPVQPPSFAFEDEGKKSNKKQKKAKKLQNGHIGGNELTNGSPTTSTHKQPTTKQSPTTKQPTEKSEASKSKKKASVTPKATTKVGRTPKEEIAKDQDAGEWTTALSRREKKLRGKKDDRQEKNTDDGWADDLATEMAAKLADSASDPPVDHGPGGDHVDSKKPLDQRGMKKDRKKKTGAGDQKTSESPAAAGKPATSAAKDAAEDKTDKEPETQNDAPEVPTKKIAEEAVETTKIDASPDKKSPKKKKKKSLRQPEQTVTDMTEATTTVEQPIDVVAETVPDTAALIAEAMEESPDVESQETQIVSNTDREIEASSVDTKAERSPKKKKKKDKEKAESLNTSDKPSEEPSHSEILTESVIASTSLSQPQQQTSEGAATDRLDAASVEETSTTQAEAASSTPKPSTSPEDQSKVTFDELGDWQEAKPVKKKKRVRKEN